MRSRKQPSGSPILAVFTLLGFIWLSHTALHRETGYMHSVFDALPKEKPYRTQNVADLRKLYSCYSSMKRDLPEDWK